MRMDTNFISINYKLYIWKEGLMLEKVFNVQELVELIIKKWWIVLLSIIVFGSGFYLYSRYVIDEQFTSVGSLYVNSKAQEVITPATVNNTANLYELTTADMLVESYKEILSSKAFFKIIKENTDVEYSVGQLQSMVFYDSVEETCVIKVRVVALDPKDANEICAAVLKYANNAIMDIVEVGSVKTIDEASMPTRHSSPNRTTNTIAGMCFGAALACLIILLMDYFDIRIKSTNDIEEKFDLVILGVIPSISKSQAEGEAGNEKV